MPRRVLIISQHTFNPMLQRSARCLTAEGVTVDVICLVSKSGVWSARGIEGVKLYTVPLRHDRSHLPRYALEYAAFFVIGWAWALLLTTLHRYDVVQVENVPDALVFAALPARWRGARVVLYMYEVVPDMVLARVGRDEHHPLVRLAGVVEQLATAWADSVVTVSEPCRRAIARRGTPACRITVIPNTQPGMISPPRPEPSTTLLMTHGTIVPRYGVDVAVRAMAQLRERWPEAVLEVLGEGEHVPELKRLTAELQLDHSVRFERFIPFNAAMQHIRQASIGLVPVIADGYGELLLPTKLLEYASQGVPIVASRLPTIQAYFPPDSVAYFTPGDAREMAEQIDRLLTNPAEAALQVERAYAALRDIAWERVSPRYFSALGLGGASAVAEQARC